MMNKKTYKKPELQWDVFTAKLMQLTESQTEMSEDPAEEPAMTHQRDKDLMLQTAEKDTDLWGNLW